VTSFLLDTNVVSELGRDRPNRGVAQWWADVAKEDCFISALTLGELRRGAARLAHRGQTLVTRNVSDVEGTGAVVLDPFTLT
jgi:predicted nucleic acid-binding protein